MLAWFGSFNLVYIKGRNRKVIFHKDRNNLEMIGLNNVEKKRDFLFYQNPDSSIDI